MSFVCCVSSIIDVIEKYFFGFLREVVYLGAVFNEGVNYSKISRTLFKKIKKKNHKITKIKCKKFTKKLKKVSSTFFRSNLPLGIQLPKVCQKQHNLLLFSSKQYFHNFTFQSIKIIINVLSTESTIPFAEKKVKYVCRVCYCTIYFIA